MGMFLKKINERLDDVHKRSWDSKHEIASLKLEVQRLIRKSDDAERALMGILDYLGVYWTVPGPSKLIKKGGPEAPE